MTVDTMATFFALLAVLGITIVVVAVVAGVWALVARREPAWSTWLRAAAAPLALPFAAAVALTCTLGSLYLSEVAGFPPCELCWYQRIAMYPLSVILVVAALRRDTSVRWYAVPIAVIGFGISVYHYVLERFPDSVASSCSVDVPCTTVWLWKFHFLSIPAMAGVGFALIITAVAVAGSGTPRGSRR